MNPHASPAHAPTSSGAHAKHSPFFLVWEMITLACVFFVAFYFLGHSYFHVGEETEHVWELAVEGAEAILVAEVVLLILVARNKINFLKKNWVTVLAVLPLGGSFRAVNALKLGWHAFEKTRVGSFLHHPIKSTKRWVHRNLGLRV